MDEQNCGNCRYYEHTPDKVLVEVYTGRCRRYPPQLIRINPMDLDDDGDLGLASLGPDTVDTDWCGEWRTRDTSRQ